MASLNSAPHRVVSIGLGSSSLLVLGVGDSLVEEGIFLLAEVKDMFNMSLVNGAS